MSCAVRGRFVKSYGAYSLYTAIFESSGKLGGLANLGNVKLTGPGFSMPGVEIVAKLVADVERYDIPVIEKKVTSISKDEKSGLFSVRDSSGAERLSRTVAICTGMRPLSNERKFFGRGVSITCMGYDYINSIIGGEIGRGDRVNFRIYGNRHSLDLFNFVLAALETGKGSGTNNADPVFIIDDDEDAFKRTPEFKAHPGLFTFGRLVEYKGGASLESVVIENSGKLFEIASKSVLIDYNSFELSPEFDIEVPDERVKRKRSGFIKADRFMKTPVDGLFAAGDITGTYFCASRAISEGIAAGFSAYEKVMEMKGFRGQSLFAYRPSGRKFSKEYREVSPVGPGDRVIVLSRAEKIEEFMKNRSEISDKSCIPGVVENFSLHGILGAPEFGKISSALGCGDRETMKLLTAMICEKLVTVA